MTHDANPLKSKEAFGEIHPIPQLMQCLWRWPSCNMAAISSHHFKSGVRQSLSKVTIIGQKQQPLSIFVEPAHCKKPLIGYGDHVNGSWTSLRVTICTQDALWFVQQKITESWNTQAFGIKADIIGFRGNTSRGIANNFTSHCHSPVPNVLFAVSTRIHSRHRKELLKPHRSRCFAGIL